MQVKKIQDLNPNQGELTDENLIVVSQSAASSLPQKQSLARLYYYILGKLRDITFSDRIVSGQVFVNVGSASYLYGSARTEINGIISNMEPTGTGSWRITLATTAYPSICRVTGQAVSGYVSSNLHQFPAGTNTFDIRIADDSSPNDYDFQIWIECLK